MPQLIVNGKSQRFPSSGQSIRTGEGTESQDSPAMTVTQLLEQMGLQGKRIAVERNGEIVPRSTFDQPLLKDGDNLEIVVAVGGG